MKSSFFCLFVLLFFIPFYATSQVFEEYILENAAGRQIVIVDLDNDGMDDIVYNTGSQIFVKLKTGPLDYTTPDLLSNAGGEYFEFVDIDNDGDRDILRAQSNHVHLNERVDTGFLAGQQFLYVIGVKDFFSGDFNGDDKPDICAGAGTDGLSLDKRLVCLMSNDITQFTTEIIGTGLSFIQRVEGIDVDEDNDLDLMAYYSSPDEIKTYLNDGAGHFAESNVVLEIEHDKVVLFTSADINNDNRTDLVYSTEDWHNSGLYVLYNEPGENWVESKLKEFEYIGSYGNVNAAVVDFDLDGDLDVYYTGSYHSEVRIAINQGNGVMKDSLIFKDPEFKFMSTITGSNVDDKGIVDPVYYSYEGDVRYIATYLETTTSTEETHLESGLFFNPNPSKDFISLIDPYDAMLNGKLYAVDMLGVHHDLHKLPGTNTVVHNLRPGIYVVVLQKGPHKILSKLIVTD